VIANAWQHRSDVGISGGVFVGLCFSIAGYPIVDPMAAVGVAYFIITQVREILYDEKKVQFLFPNVFFFNK
jgi:divalent metal cation (Fe/Co/Zn/Cd) transporter